MVLLWWIDLARNNLSAANNSYAEIQKQLDRYNKVFDVYSKASPETQIRAASVMRQALNEYNGLKKQQEENALRIYEAQNWINYYNSNPSNTITQTWLTETTPVSGVAPVETISIVTAATPGTLNNNVPATNIETNAIDTDTTMNVTTPVATVNQTYTNATTPVWVTRLINAQTPKYPNTSIRPANSPYNYTWINYGAGSVAPSPKINTYNSLVAWKRWNPNTRRSNLLRIMR